MRARDEQKQKAIKEKAMQIVAKQGIESLSMQKLAKAADVSPATLYIYFKDKEDLLLQLCKEAGEKMMEMTFKNFDPSMSFSEGLKMQWVNRAKYCLKYPDQLLFLEQIRYSRLHEKYMGMMNENFKINMQSFVHNAIKRKELVNWSIAFAPLYNLIKFHQAGKSFGGRKFVFSEKIMMETFELVLKALQP